MSWLLLAGLCLAAPSEPAPADEARAAEPTPFNAQLTLGAWAAHSSARHRIRPAAGLQLSYGPRPWGITGELLLAQDTRPSDLYRFSTTMGRASAVFEWVGGTEATSLHAGLGPALTARRVQSELLDRDDTRWLAEPGLRLRVGLDGPLGPLSWSWGVGSTSRSLRTWDYDVHLGLGGRW
ncbi:MAG: hypothetical protein H6740_00895 [Alphaproteobacteria bacterium]|nr:hypothetical protein [Alphaproteobacteria bacterium]